MRRTSKSARWALAIIAALAAMARDAAAHDGRPLEPHDLLGAWVLDLWVVVPLIVGVSMYLAGVRRVWRGAGAGSGVRRWQVACFLSGWVVLVLALVSPVHALGAVLLSAHMVQHEMLMVVAAPLLVLGRPGIAGVWALSPRDRQRVGRVARHARVRTIWRWVATPGSATVIHGLAVWFWHTPRVYEGALGSEFAHATQHIGFLGSALLFWWAVLGPRVRGPRALVGVGALFVTALHTGALGALLTFSETLWFPVYAATTGPWGLTPAEDQHLAGLIMWIPGGLAYVVAALGITAHVLQGGLAARAIRAAVGVGVLVGFAGCGLVEEREADIAGGDVDRGRVAIQNFGCPTRHVIPGIRGATGLVGPPLAGIAARMYIGGVLPNTPDNMIQWIIDPKRIDSLTAMPALGVSETSARDIAEYLYTLR